MKVAIVHDWLVSYRGGEKVLEAILSLYPNAPVYTLFYDREQMPKSISDRQIIVPGTLNFFRRFRKALLPVLPACIESLPLKNYDLVISTSSCVAKGLIPGPEGRHICYLHSPMRYIWDQQEEYLKQFANIPLLPQIFRLLASRLRLWDRVSSGMVDSFVVNSGFVQQRVARYYNADSEVIFPPVDTEFFCLPEKGIHSEPKNEQDYFLVAGAFVPYKGFELAIHACERLGKKLIVAGSGPGLKQLRKISGKFTEFRISPDNESWKELLQGAKALLFPGVEDFGMIAVEAMACGTPVIALEKGGAMDFVVPGKTGEFFKNPGINDLEEALKNFEPSGYNGSEIRNFAENFSKDIFLEKFKSACEKLMKGAD